MKKTHRMRMFMLMGGVLIGILVACGHPQAKGELLDNCCLGAEKDGLHQRYYEDGTLESEAYCINKKVNGSYKIYHKNGKLKIEAYYKDEKRDGPYKEYYENGHLKYLMSFKDGMMGIWRFYDETGTLIGEK